MISKIQAFFKQYLSETSTETAPLEHRLQLACAALMVEVMHADDTVSTLEKNKIQRLLERKFQLSEKEISSLLELAEEEKHDATDYFEFTSLLNRHFTREQKITLIEDLWALAFVDKELDKYEEHLIRRLADLLHVPHSEFIKTKNRVQIAQ